MVALGLTFLAAEPAGHDQEEAGACKSGVLHLMRVGDGEQHRYAAEDTGDTDVLHYELDIEIVPDTEWLGGSNTITVRCVVDGLTTCALRLHDVFTITDVQVNGTPADWQRASSTTIEVSLDREYDAGEEFGVLVAYDGYPEGAAFGSIIYSTRGGYPLVFTLSEPWFAYTWWPAKDDNTDKATGNLKITVPHTLTVASNGLLLAVDDVGRGRDRYHWQTAYQTATYLFSFSAAYYNTFGDVYEYDGGSMPLEFFIFPDNDTENNRNKWRKTVDILGTFADVFGLYPFVGEKYGIYQFGFGGGMEHQTMTGQGGFSEWITAHELGHFWWGNMITCGTWQDIWLNEGFATYSEALWREFKPGSSGTPELHAHMASRRPSNVNGSVYIPAEDADDVGRIFSYNFTYKKAAWVLHQLRHVVGDETFFDILAAYRQAFVYNSAITEDLRIVAESVYGADLTWFFDEWVYDIGAPAYRYAWRQITVADRDFVELYVTQVQSESYPIFTMPLDVVTNGPGGDVVTVVWNDAEAEHLLFEVSGEVYGLELDPEDWTLHTSNEPTAFVEGPPKVVTTLPEPGGVAESSAELTIEITFHKDVLADAQDFALIGDTTGAMDFAFDYDTDTHTATLISDGGWPADDYTLTISDAIIDLAAGLALDGEVADPSDASALPSGEGLPGGEAVIRFTVTPRPADLDGNGNVGPFDLALLLGNWGPCPQEGDCPADLNGDGAVGASDLAILLGNWG
ncbi:MAG: M1 family aminopeptidase [Phycisphaeraceae bacterium]